MNAFRNLPIRRKLMLLLLAPCVVVLCVLCLSAVGLVAVAALVSSRLHRFISERVLRLAETARQVADRTDYSVRAREEQGKEFGVLTRAFNQMLARIQAQEAQQREAAVKLEGLNRELIETSRQIGRAEIATGVLHNVGNVLNSINVSTLGMTRNGGDFIKISVRDNGVGISPENLARLFQHGFTTRKEGHGFGLHSGLLAAKEMGGALHAASDGPGKGALFTLELPIAKEAKTTG